MPVYYIDAYDITDAEEFSKYVPMVRPVLYKHGAEVIVADFEARTVEGTPRKVNAVVKFPSEEAAMNFYNDPDYLPAKQLRLRSTANCTIVLANEWVKTS